MNAVIEIDKRLEIAWHEIRNSVKEYLRTSDRVTRTITAVTCILWETLINANNSSTNDYIGRLMVYLIWFSLSEICAKKKWVTKQSNEQTINPNIIILSLNRLWLLVWSSSYMAVQEKADFISIFAYIAISYHDSDWKTIRNWIEAKFKTLKESLKKPEAEPSPT